MTIPVLTYHHVSPCRDLQLNVAPEVFERQMRYLHDNNYRTLTMDELYLYCTGHLELREKALTLTFDDGWLDNYVFAFPALKRYGIKASIFIITDRIEEASNCLHYHRAVKKYSRLCWDELREMASTGLVGVYSHTATHRNCTELSRYDLMTELEGSRIAVENRLNKPCPYLCLPYGKFDDATKEVAVQAGYVAMLTTIPGVVIGDTDPLTIKRLGASSGLMSFRLKLRVYLSPALGSLYFHGRGVLRRLKKWLVSFHFGYAKEFQCKQGYKP